VLQIREEIESAFDFLSSVYGIFGFTFKLKLSTRPEKYVGDIATWDAAEKKLEEALESFAEKTGAKWEFNPGDGAFYGPKIDIALYDALKREHQCGTMQLDFNLPRRFKLRYVANKGESGVSDGSNPEEELPAGYARPVMIHRAVLGSFERMFGILTEHFAGKWPFWLSPRQVLVVPVMPAANDYAKEVQQIFRAKGLYSDVDLSSNTFQKKIRTGQLEQYNFIFGKFGMEVTCNRSMANFLTQLLAPRRPVPAPSTFVTETTRPLKPRVSWSLLTRLLRSWYSSRFREGSPTSCKEI
jgi:threonyl-tRNA synthetase